MAEDTVEAKILGRAYLLLALVESTGAMMVVTLELGLGAGEEWLGRALFLGDLLVVGAAAARILLTGIRGWRRLLRLRTLAAVALGVGLGTLSFRLTTLIALIHDAYGVAEWFRREHAGERVLRGVSVHPARALALSFASMIALGTLLLSLPAAAAGPRVPPLDALFTAVSATCVTGLITVDTSTVWSPFGLGVIFALFQLGGIGIMTISGAATMALGNSLDARHSAELRDAFDEHDAEELRRLIRTLVTATLCIEAVGALLLFARFSGDLPWAQALWQGVFHSVSAFCNAGFSLNADSLVAYAGDPIVNGVVMSLITLGGLGFGVMVALWRRYVMRRSPTLTPHARLVLTMNAGLWVVGALGFFFFEFDGALAALPLDDKLLGALFQSVTCRTAGFNTVSLDHLHPVTLLLMMALMIVGASPGSTGGGIKTTTLAVVLMAARAFVRERRDVELYGRTLPQVQVLRAMALIGGFAVAAIVGFGALLVTETLRFEDLLFETVSALGTVGLSVGITSELSGGGKSVVALLMFAGRVGPLTAVAALSKRRLAVASVTYPEGKVIVG